MQSVSSWIWTRVAVSISFNDNHYTMATSLYIIEYILSVLNWNTWNYTTHYNIFVFERNTCYHNYMQMNFGIKYCIWYTIKQIKPHCHDHIK